MIVKTMELVIKIVMAIKIMTYKSSITKKKKSLTWTRNWLRKYAKEYLLLISFTKGYKHYTVKTKNNNQMKRNNWI